MMPRTPRVVATDAGRDLIATLKAKHGPLMFHQSGGCCDGSSPMCYPAGGFMVGATDVLLGELEGCPFYMGEDQFAYWDTRNSSSMPCPGAAAPFRWTAPRAGASCCARACTPMRSGRAWPR